MPPKYELTGLLNKGPCLLTAEFVVGGETYPVVIDTGASISVLPRNGRILDKIQHKIRSANLAVILADGTSTVIDRKVVLPLKPIGSRSPPEQVVFYVQDKAYEILGKEALIGLNHLRLFDIKIQVKGNKFEIYHQDRCIGRETPYGRGYLNVVKVDTRFDDLKADESVVAIIKRYKRVFGDIGPEPIYGKPMRIFTTHQRPIFSKQRNYNPTEIMQMKEHVNALLSKGIIEPTSSGYAATSRIIPKKSGASRLVINYIPLNRCTVRDSYVLPQIADIFGVVQGKKWFTTMDCAQGFYQILVDKRDRHKTAFSTPVGNFQFVRCPFGARNSPAVFQSEINRIFADGLYSKCIVYVDDILVFGRTRAEHDDNLQWVLEQCAKFNVKIKLEKCVFGKQEVDYLGFTINGTGIKPQRPKIESMGEMKAPTDKTELRSFVGKMNFYARFIPDYSRRLEPFRELFRCNREFQWKSHHQKAYEGLLVALKNTTSQALVGSQEEKFLEIYIMNDSIEVACLDQKERLISRAGRFLLSAEINYSLVEKQLLALVFGVSKFRIWLEPNRFTVRLPTRDLEKTMKLVHRPSRIDAWMLRLPEGFDEFQFEVKDSLSAQIGKKMPAHIPEEVYYIDGACKANGKDDCKASWAVCAEYDTELELTGQLVENPSNNAAEVMAAIKACEIAKERGQQQITIVTDSKYVRDAMTVWIDKWRKNDWLDHKNKPVVNEKLFKQLINVKEGLQVEWIHVKGHSDNPGNVRVDALARAELDDNCIALCAALTTGQEVQRDCPETEALRDLIRKGLKPQLVEENDLIYYIDMNLGETNNKRIFVPTTSRCWLLQLAHDDQIYGGHFGIKKTYRKLLRFWWPGMNRDVEEYVKTCDTCQRFKNPTGLPPGYLQSIPVSRIFEHVHVDMVGPIKTTFRGNSYIITATDAMSKWVFARPCHNIRTAEVIKFIEECIIAIHGKPEMFITDRGAQFTSHEWKRWLEGKEIAHNLTTPRHPQSNGIDERVNGTMARILQKYVDRFQENWDEQLKYAIYVYNTTVHESTGFSPYQILFGREPRSPLRQDALDKPPDIDALDRIRETIRSKANELNKESQVTQKKHYDRHHRAAEIDIGQLVLVRELFISTELSKKLHPKWEGPYVVIGLKGEQKNPKAVTVLNCDDLSRRTVSINDVKAYHGRDPNPIQEQECHVDRQHEDVDDPGLFADTDTNHASSDTEKSAETVRHSELSHSEESCLDLVNTNNRESNFQFSSSPRRVTISDKTDIREFQRGPEESLENNFTWNSTTTRPETSSGHPGDTDDAATLPPNDPPEEDAGLGDTTQDLTAIDESSGAVNTQRQTSVDRQEGSIAGNSALPYKSPYVMDFIIDNSTADPTYKPPGSSSNAAERSSGRNKAESRRNTPATSRPRSKRTFEPVQRDSPLPWRLRPTARRALTLNQPNQGFISSDRGPTAPGSDESGEISDALDTNPALTSGSDTDEDRTLTDS